MCWLILKFFNHRIWLGPSWIFKLSVYMFIIWTVMKKVCYLYIYLFRIYIKTNSVLFAHMHIFWQQHESI